MDIKSLFTDLKDRTKEFNKKEIESGKAMAILSYIGLLCLIPFFAEKNNKYVRFHAVQGLNILILGAIYGAAYAVLSAILIFIPFIGIILLFALGILSYGFAALFIWGIVNACCNNAKELPIVNKIKIIKE